MVLPAPSVSHRLKKQTSFEVKTFLSQLFLSFSICIVFTCKLGHFQVCQTLQDKLKGRPEPSLHLHCMHLNCACTSHIQRNMQWSRNHIKGTIVF